MIQFMKYKKVYFLVSSFFLIPGILSLAFWGLKPSIDFTGGALLELEFSNLERVNVETIKTEVSTLEDISVGTVQSVSDTNRYIIRLNHIDENKKNTIITKLSELETEIEEIRFETVGPVLGGELLIKTGVAILIVSLIILAYVAHQFKDRIYGLASILAMFHDSLILIGIFSLLGHFFDVEVDTLFVTALLTVLSFSIHDTIVVFDRVREILRNKQAKNLEDAVNKAIMQTLVRSLNNSMTIIFMLAALSILGGTSTRWFVTALLIGTISGTYSSTFTAAPLLIELTKRLNKK